MLCRSVALFCLKKIASLSYSPASYHSAFLQSCAYFPRWTHRNQTLTCIHIPLHTLCIHSWMYAWTIQYRMVHPFLSVTWSIPSASGCVWADAKDTFSRSKFFSAARTWREIWRKSNNGQLFSWKSVGNYFLPWPPSTHWFLYCTTFRSAIISFSNENSQLSLYQFGHQKQQSFNIKTHLSYNYQNQKFDLMIAHYSQLMYCYEQYTKWQIIKTVWILWLCNWRSESLLYGIHVYRCTHL